MLVFKKIKFFKLHTLWLFLFLLFIIGTTGMVYGQQDSGATSDDKSLKVILKDKSLSVEEFVSGLDWPTTMTFVGNDILVLEKNEGNVRLIRNGKLQNEPVLKIDLNISANEAGLLGILAKNSTVYIHFATGNPDDKTTSNFFYKYYWDGNKLTQPTLLKEIHGGSGTHNAGPMVLHPDGTVYAILGDLNNRKGILQNYPEGEPDNTSTIFSLDKTTPYHAIGIRNSFGLAIDPVTGYMWDTENGQSDFDEINLVPPQFNSGWASIQGPATQEEIEKLPTFNGYSYSDPEFSWEEPIAVTAISFIQSKLFEEYHNSVLVGDFNNGVLYKFNLNKDRTGFIFNDPVLSDLVLNKDDYTNEIILGIGFLGITDIKEGPDGLIYIVSIIDGKIYRIFPSKDTSDDVSRCLETPKQGINLSGCDLSRLNLQDSDLSHADLSFSNLARANLTNINLESTILSGSNLWNVHLSDIDISNADLNSVILSDAKLENINFQNANLKSIDLKNSKLLNVDLTNVNLNNAILDNVVLENVKMQNIDLLYTSFKQSTLKNSNLSNSQVWKTDFTDADLSGTNFMGTDIHASNFTRTNLQNTDFRNSKIGDSIFLQSDLSGTNFLGVYPFYTLFDSVIITEETKINTCLEHDLTSRIINRILREIRDGNFSFLNFLEIPIAQLCKIS